MAEGTAGSAVSAAAARSEAGHAASQRGTYRGNISVLHRKSNLLEEGQAGAHAGEAAGVAGGGLANHLRQGAVGRAACLGWREAQVTIGLGRNVGSPPSSLTSG